MDKESKEYIKAKKLADKKFSEPTSAYKSMYIVKMYKKFGGKFKKKKSKSSDLKRWLREEWVRINPKTGKPIETNKKKIIKKYIEISEREKKRISNSSKKKKNVKRTINGKKINVKVDKDGKPIIKTFTVTIKKRIPCGRNREEKTKLIKKGLCRPYKRVNAMTPKTVKELGSKELKRRASAKKKNPNKRITQITSKTKLVGGKCFDSSRLNRYYNCIKEKVIEIEKSDRKGKKYKATIDCGNDKKRTIHFGALDYQHYRDSTKLKLYKKLDHGSTKRRNSYYSRHSGVSDRKQAISLELMKSRGKLNAKLLSHVYLW